MKTAAGAEVTTVQLSEGVSREERTEQEFCAVLAYLAILSYPSRQEWGKRDDFVEAAKAWIIKKLVHKKGARGLIGKYRLMKNQQIDGILRRACHRIRRRRLPAGQLANLLALNSFPNAKVTVDGKKLSARRFMEWQLKNLFVEPTAALANEHSRTWIETKPVLHLAMVYPRADSESTDNPFSPFAHPADLMLEPARILRPIQNSEWVRQMLPAFVPNFDPCNSVRLLLRK